MRPSVAVSFALALALCLCVSSVAAWGPISHYKFATDFVAQSAPQQWIGELDVTSLLTASDLPDGMWNGWFLSGTKCDPTANRLHSPILGGYLIQAANNSQWSDAQRSFAIGYATHVVSDEVGFASQGGYLGNLSAVIDWSTEWPFMLAVDALILQEAPAWYPSGNLPSSPTSSDNIDFLAQIVAQYHATSPNAVPLLNATQLLECSDPWAPQVTQMNALSRTQIPAATVQQLLFFDRFGAKSIQDVANNLQASWNCIAQTLEYFLQCLLGNVGEGGTNMTPEMAWKVTAQYIVDLYAAGECTVNKPQ